MILKIKVKPNSSKSAIEKVAGNEYLAYLRAMPEKNKANKELTKILSKKFKTKSVKIKNPSSRNKIVEVK